MNLLQQWAVSLCLTWIEHYMRERGRQEKQRNRNTHRQNLIIATTKKKKKRSNTEFSYLSNSIQWRKAIMFVIDTSKDNIIANHRLFSEEQCYWHIIFHKLNYNLLKLKVMIGYDYFTYMPIIDIYFYLFMNQNHKFTITRINCYEKFYILKVIT